MKEPCGQVLAHRVLQLGDRWLRRVDRDPARPGGAGDYERGGRVVDRCRALGVVVGLGEFSKALALAGFVNREPRAPESWR